MEYEIVENYPEKRRRISVSKQIIIYAIETLLVEQAMIVPIKDATYNSLTSAYSKSGLKTKRHQLRFLRHKNRKGTVIATAIKRII